VGLESFFSIGSSAIASAQNTFTNRTSELSSFDDAVALRKNIPLNALPLVEDITGSRNNVLMYYGLGGIGKSRLSRELQVRYRSNLPDSEERLTFRVNFDSGEASDYEGILLGLRACLGTFRPVWPAFDLAFAAYWERAHPGKAMQEALNDSSAIRRFSGELQLGTQLQDGVESILNSPGGLLGIFTAGARLVGRSVRDRIIERRVMEECPFFGRIIAEPNPQEMRIYLAVLMAWDLAKLQQEMAVRGKNLNLVIFFDTWEKLQEGEGGKGNFEDLISRMIYLMPNVLFVITGRDQLRWADAESRAKMMWAGPDAWPNLADDSGNAEPRQHLVGGLSDKDADRFLILRLQRSGQALIPPEIRTTIVRAAAGVPLYLDLAAVRYAQVVTQGRIVQEDDFGQPFPEVVLRIMKDLDHEQRSLLRMASMVSRFDEDLLLAGSPSLPDSALIQFVRRSIVQAYPQDFLPYGIHESLRDAVHQADIAEDRWSEREWTSAADRLLTEIHKRIIPELQASGSLDNASLAGYFLESMRLATCSGKMPPWVWQLAGRLHSLGAWDALAAANSVVVRGNSVRPAARALAAIAGRRENGPRHTADVLSRSLESDFLALDATGSEYISYWLAWMLDELGDWETAESVRLRLSASTGEFAPYLRHALGRSYWVRGQLSTALSSTFDEADPLQRFWKTGIHGRVKWISGHFAEADALYLERISAAEQIKSPELLAHALRTRAELLCFTDPNNRDGAEEAIELYRRAVSPVSEAETLVALEVSRCGQQAYETTKERLGFLRPYLGHSPHADVAEIFASCLAGDIANASAVRQSMISEMRGGSYRFWLDITGWWIEDAMGVEQTFPAAGTDWIHGVEDARRRWIAVIRSR
jgi:hypothetical protein